MQQCVLKVRSYYAVYINIKKILFQNVLQRGALPLVDVQWDLVLVVCLLKQHVVEQLKTIALMFSK